MDILTTGQRPDSAFLPLMVAELALASAETIAWRTMMMAQGTCTPGEYVSMVMEKAEALQHTAVALSQFWIATDLEALVAPWHIRATANARRLRAA
jgi:hypothetical protein